MSNLIAESVYIIAKALPKNELGRLYDMLQKDMSLEKKFKKNQKKKLISDENALAFILKTVFTKN